MATCKDCLHYEVCVIVEHSTSEDEDYLTEFGCDDFKDHSKWMEQKCGRWIEKTNPWGQDGSHSYDCSNCGERTCVVGQRLRYCPNCGAKMEDK